MASNSYMADDLATPVDDYAWWQQRAEAENENRVLRYYLRHINEVLERLPDDGYPIEDSIKVWRKCLSEAIPDIWERKPRKGAV